MNWKQKDWKKVLIDETTGKYLLPEESKRQFIKWISEGKKVVPIGECSNFDYQKGCLGHDK
jgi:hypothetical protein